MEIEDDGIGRDHAKEIQLKHERDHKSLATTITRERIRVINKKRSEKIKMEVVDLKNETGNAIGTRVIFTIPV